MELTKTVKSLLLVNIALFLLTYLFSITQIPFIREFVLYSIKSEEFQVHQLLTYMFLHSSITHIVFNMIGLAVFGPEVERRFGSTKFLKIYLLSGAVAGLFHILFIDNPVVGASGAVWSLMVIYALFNPEHIFHIYFLIPAKIKYIVSVFFIIELYLAFVGNDGVSHIAHIGGAITGFMIYTFGRK